MEFAAKFGVERSTISKIGKRKDAIRKELQELGARSVRPVRKRIVVTGDYPFKDVDRATFVWVTQVRANATQLNITGDMIMLKATKFATMLGVSTAVSSGWLTGFLNRYGITSVRRCSDR